MMVYRMYLLSAESEEHVDKTIKNIKEILPTQKFINDFYIPEHEVLGEHPIFYRFTKSSEGGADFLIYAYVEAGGTLEKLDEIMDSVSKLESVKYFKVLAAGNPEKLKEQFEERYGSNA